MKINNSASRNSVSILVNYIKNNDFESCFQKMSYLTGIYAVFYTAAILDNLDQVQKMKFLDELSKRCDTQTKIETKTNENQNN